jgi:hypothetical protein
MEKNDNTEHKQPDTAPLLPETGEPAPSTDRAAAPKPPRKRKSATVTGTGVTKKLGRPSKYTAAARDALCEAVELGCNLTEAAAMVGVQAETLRRWRESHPELQPALEAAEARGIQKRLKTISDAAEDNPKWAAWILEHRWPDRWSRANRGQVEVHVNGDQSQVRVVDAELCDQISESWKRFEASRREATADTGQIDVPPDPQSN